MPSPVGWFDIPVRDMERATAFYSAVTGQTLKRMPVGSDKETALFESGGCLFRAPEDQPSHFGSRVYFETPSIEEWLERVERAGGKTLVAKTPIGGDRGFFAYFEDSEGNRVGLHSPR
jgi:predicted enzyme related to lactoylglutathione lyase